MLAIIKKPLLHVCVAVDFIFKRVQHFSAYQIFFRPNSYVRFHNAIKQTIVTRLPNITKSDKFSSIKDLMIQKDGKLFAAENVFGTVAVEVITCRAKIS